MTKKFLMYFLMFAFVIGVVIVFLLAKKKIPETSISLPFRATPSPESVSSVPTPTGVPQLSQLESDLTLIENDISKLTNKDNRFTPPDFIFDLGLQ